MTGSEKSSTGGDPLLTLEPLIQSVRDGLESAGWSLSGLQKTTSHEFEGRWAGQSTRSAYLFFHRPDLQDDVSIDVFLDETPRGLSGNLALVVDGRSVGDLPPVSEVLDRLSEAADEDLLERYRIPVAFRVRMDPRGDEPVAEAETEVRFKLRIPRGAINAGSDAVATLAGAVTEAFEQLLGHPAVNAFRLPPSPGG
jgi:hypothetical protein